MPLQIRNLVLFGMILELFSVSTLNNLHPFLFLRYFLFDALLYVSYGFLYGSRWAVCCVAWIGHLTVPSGLQLDVWLDRSLSCATWAFAFDQLDVIYAGPDRSFYWAIQAFAFDQLDVIYAGPDRSFYCAIRSFAFDQLDVIYAGPDRSFYCTIRAFAFD